DFHVTGVQTCALPIYEVERGEICALRVRVASEVELAVRRNDPCSAFKRRRRRRLAQDDAHCNVTRRDEIVELEQTLCSVRLDGRSEERRVGEEWGSGW